MSTDYIANLPWYDSEITSPLLDQVWRTLAELLRANGYSDVPLKLQREQQVRALWLSPQLVMSQCCGPDLFTAEGADLSVIARPVFAELDCTPGCYYSYVVSRQKKLNPSCRIAVNSYSSRSGYAALMEWMRDRDIDVSEVHVSGSHIKSLSMLKHGVADLAAIDAHLINQFKVELELPTVGRTNEALAPPFVCHHDVGINRDLLYRALEVAITEHGKEVGITGLVRCDRDDYDYAGMNGREIV